MRDDRRAFQPLPELDRDRGRCAAPRVVERLGFLLGQAAEIVELEMGFVAGGGKHAPDGAGDGADPGAAGRELPTGLREPIQKVSTAPGFKLGQLGEGLDGTARHPAGAVGPVVPKLLDSFGE